MHKLSFFKEREIFFMFAVYEVEETEDRTKLEFDQENLKDYLHPEKVFIIIKEDLKRIYLWKGARAPVRKRFIASRFATEIQGDLKNDGFSHCKIVSVDQGDEVDEFLNIFNLESMDIKKKAEDMHILMNSEREKLEKANLFSKKDITPKSTKLDEIKAFLEEHEKILWVKSFTLEINDKGIKKLLKDKHYKGRIKNPDKFESIESSNYEIRYVITDKKIITNNVLNQIFDYSDYSEEFFRKEGKIILIDLNGVESFDVEETEDSYNIWFNIKSENKDKTDFLFDKLSFKEYVNIVEIFTVLVHFRAKIPKNSKLKYIPSRN